MAVVAVGCVPSQIRKTLPVLSTRDASYAGHWFYWLPRWHRLYSLLPGPVPAECDDASFQPRPGVRRTLAFRNCSDADDKTLDGLAVRLGTALDRIEASLGSIRVASASYTLVPPDRMLIHSRSQWLRPRSLVFDIAVRYQSEDLDIWEVAAVRGTAHELYHLRNRAMRRPVAEDHRGWSEEMRAALFESCIEMQVFGSVDSRAMDPRRQSEPGVVDRDTDVYSSMQGNLLATSKLASIAGADQRISSPLEARQLEALCDDIAD